jgi:CMP-N,N'-diacetyllegionaminic acid synthase
MKILAIIPMRGGSKRLPDKNTRLLCGNPLAYYTIREARKSKYIDKLIALTDDKNAAGICTAAGISVVNEPVELAQDNSLVVYALKYAIEHLGNQYHPTEIMLLQVTSPLRLVEDIDGVVEQYIKEPCDSVVSVCETEHPIEWMYRLDNHKMIPIIADADKVQRSQDASKVYRLNGAVYITKRDIIVKENRIRGSDTRAYIMPWERSVDIDNAQDFQMAEILMSQRCNT